LEKNHFLLPYKSKRKEVKYLEEEGMPSQQEASFSGCEIGLPQERNK